MEEAADDAVRHRSRGCLRCHASVIRTGGALMKGLSVLVLIFLIDSIVGLVQGNNMYTLKPGGSTGVVINVITLIACLILGPALWKAAERRDLNEAIRRYQEDGDQSALAKWHRTYH